MHDSSTCPVCQGLPTHGSLSDAEFKGLLATCRDELIEKQRRFCARIESADQWWYDLPTRTLTVGSAAFAITAIGTHSGEQQSWLWAWANESFPEHVRAESAALKRLFERTGFRVFTDPGLPASADDAQDLTAFAVHELSALAFFRCPADGGPTLYLAVHEHSAGRP
jgi:hypothetical protein